MSVSSVPLICERIKGAIPNSRIAVFACGKVDALGLPLFDAIFADTVGGKRRMVTDCDFIGVYHWASGAEDFRAAAADRLNLAA